MIYYYTFQKISNITKQPHYTLPKLYITHYTYKGAVEQKAWSTYEYLIDLAEDPAVLAPLHFLREREIIHFQRFGEALDIARDHMNQQHYFFMQQNGCNAK